MAAPRNERIDLEQLLDPTHRLFHSVFAVKVGYVHTLDKNVVETYGAPSSGCPDQDAATADSLIDSAFTIPKLIEFYINGIPFYLTTKSNDRDIYELCLLHIRKWKEYVQKTNDFESVPLDDLRVIGEFATAIYAVRDRTLDDVKEEFSAIDSIYNNSSILKPLASYIKEDKKERKTVELQAPHSKDVSILDKILYGS